MKTIISFIRHGDVYNPNSIHYGRMPRFPLNENGRQQAYRAGEVLLNFPPPSVIFSGPLLRARQTAMRVGYKFPDLKINTSTLLNEVYTPFDGYPRYKLSARDWDLYTGTQPPYEQPQDVLVRTLKFIKKILKRYQGKHIIAVTHGDSISFLTLWALKLPLTLTEKRMHFPALASISSFTFYDNDFENPEINYIDPRSLPTTSLTEEILNPIKSKVKKTGKILNDRNTFFPSDPFNSHTAIPEWSYQEIREQKLKNYAGMLNLASVFQGASNDLVELASYLANQCHFNHFRGGKGRFHYSIHLLEVAKRVDKNFDYFEFNYEKFWDKSGNFLHPKAVAISVALLHDAIEDFGQNFKSNEEKLTDQEAQKISENFIYEAIEKYIGSVTAGKIVKLIKNLSIYNEDEFPDTHYLTVIKDCPYTYVVKLADVDHNLSTIVDFIPAYPCFVVPSQYGNFANDTVYERSYKEFLLINLEALRPDEDVPWLTEKKQKCVDQYCDQVVKYEGNAGFHRIRTYYTKLRNDIKNGTFDPLLNSMSVTRDHIIQKVYIVLSYVSSD